MRNQIKGINDLHVDRQIERQKILKQLQLKKTEVFKVKCLIFFFSALLHEWLVQTQAMLTRRQIDSFMFYVPMACAYMAAYSTCFISVLSALMGTM